MNVACGAYYRGKTHCPKPAKEMKFAILPLCDSHLAKVQSEMRREFYKGKIAGGSELITKSLDEIRATKDTKMVYFIRAGRRVKIGFSGNPESRLSSIRAGGCKAPRGLDTSRARIAALEPGGRQRETELHQKFAHLRESGEWFRGAPELTDYINELIAA